MSFYKLFLISNTNLQANETEKYPINIQKLFAVKPPLVYKPPLDYPAESRCTNHITSVSSLRNQWQQYVDDLVEAEKNQPPPRETIQQVQIKEKGRKKQELQKSYQRQLNEWNDPDLLQKNEQEFMKDPFKTVFISRLDYLLTELDISKNFSKYGVIESITIVRDKKLGKSRGYGFVVFERDEDAKGCIKELAPTGLKIPVENKPFTRTILVDMERGRLVRNWKPRRLGGGLGGRHYTRPSPTLSNNASAAASGRRLHLSSNPYQNTPLHPSHLSTRYVPRPSAPRPMVENRQPRPAAYGSYNSLVENNESVRDKYAKYSSNNDSNSSSYRSPRTSGQNRSIRSIRQRE